MDNRASQARIFSYLPFVGALALIVALYWTTFSWWWFEWTYPGSFYAHAVFVPFFVGVMIWRNRERLAVTAWRPTHAGLALVLLAMALLLVAQRSEVTTVKSISFVLLLLGVSLQLLGRGKMRQLLFPLAFVVMMMPLIPDQLINSIAFPIQMASARIATALLNLLTLHSEQHGTLIQMENYKMAVELPCSGFKTLVSLLTFSAAFAYLVEAPLWKRWTLFLTTAPLSLIINGLRITFIGVVGELVGPKAAGVFHDYSGFIVLIMAFAFLFNFARFLKCESFLGVPLYEAPTADTPEAISATDAETGPLPLPWWKEILSWRPTSAQLRRVLPYALSLDLLLAVTLIGQQGFIKQAPSLPPIATSQVPLKFAANGVTYTDATSDTLRDKLTKEVQEALNPTRILSRDYTGSDGSHIGFFMTAGNGRKVFHDPHTCMLGNDAIMQDVGTVDIPTKYGTVRVLETHVKTSRSSEEFDLMFCYVVEGEIVQRTEQMRNKMIWQTLFGDSGKPSYFFRIEQQVAGTEPQRRQELINFIGGMWNEIGPILKGEKPGLPEAPPVPVKEENAH